MRKLLDELYEKIRNYEKEKDKVSKEVERIKGEITNLSTSLSFTDNLSKIEKMKKQMDLSHLQSKLELSEMEKENSSNSDLVNLEKEINFEMNDVESAIYVVTRFNDLKYFIPLKKLREKYANENFKFSTMKNFIVNNMEIKNEKTNLEILPELSSIYEYYKQISDVENEIINSLPNDKEKMEAEIKLVKNNKFISEDEKKKRIEAKRKEYSNVEKIVIHEQKLDMLEELIDEMAAEVIREDMKKNNITLPEFVKGMRYFKSEDEEEIEDLEIVD